MIFERQYRPWLCAGDDDARPTLHHALIERTGDTKGLCVTSDGFSMLVLPVVLVEGEEVGLIRCDLLRYARAVPKDRSLARTKGDTYRVRFELEWAVMPDGSRHLRELGIFPPFPDWRGIVEKAVVGECKECHLDPNLLRRVAWGLGAEYGYLGGVTLTLTGQGPKPSPILVRPTGMAGGPTEPPYGLVMPMRRPT